MDAFASARRTDVGARGPLHPVGGFRAGEVFGRWKMMNVRFVYHIDFFLWFLEPLLMMMLMWIIERVSFSCLDVREWWCDEEARRT